MILTQEQLQLMRKNVLDYVRRKKAEPGHYHDGVYGVKEPVRDLYISRPALRGAVAVSFCCGYQMFDFIFEAEEINETLKN